MKKITREMIENVVHEKAQKVTEHTAEILLENMDNCIDNHRVFEDKNFANQLTNTMIPISTAYQISVLTMINVLCELFCEEGEECK